MSAPKSAVNRAKKELQEAADALDMRRQQQITNQVATIDRLMKENEALREENARLRASQVFGYGTGQDL